MKEELEKMWAAKTTVVLLVVVTPKLGKWLYQIPGTTSETTKIQHFLKQECGIKMVLWHACVCLQIKTTE